MGKGFNNYMCKKFFHPASRDNLKRVWIAEQKSIAEKAKQEELRSQYEKEQELYNNKAILAKSETRDKLSLNFMYEAPAGVKRDREKEDGEPEYKFEWQRKFKGPRESYCKDDDTIRDQPFGIAVRNVRCIKCKNWGHINTDKECPLYGRVIETEGQKDSDINELAAGMREDGLKLKTLASMTTGIYGNRQNPNANNQHYLSSDEESVDEMTLLKTLSSKDKKRLLKKLEKMDKQSKDKKDKKKKKKRKKSVSSSSSSESSSDSESEEEKSKKKRKKNKKNKKKKHQESSSSDTSDSEDERTKKRKKKKNKDKEEENDPQQLLKEITKGLNIDFVGGGNNNPFSMGNVKIKKEKCSDDENDRKKRSKELRNESHENTRKEIKQEKEDLSYNRERNERESRDRNRERNRNQDQKFRETERCPITDGIREIRDMMSGQNDSNRNIKYGDHDRMEVRRDRSKDRRQRTRSQSRDRRIKIRSRSRDRRNRSSSRNRDRKNRSPSITRNGHRSRSGSFERRNRNRSRSKEHRHRSESKERKNRSRSHSRERRHKSRSKSRDRKREGRS
ncbi:unnamed protein product, partial [Meganyctiphanes norvegica]